MRLHPHEGISTAFRCPQEPQEGFPEEAAELILTGSLWAIKEAGGEAQPGRAPDSSHQRPMRGEGGNQWPGHRRGRKVAPRSAAWDPVFLPSQQGFQPWGPACRGGAAACRPLLDTGSLCNRAECGCFQFPKCTQFPSYAPLHSSRLTRDVLEQRARLPDSQAPRWGFLLFSAVLELESVLSR